MAETMNREVVVLPDGQVVVRQAEGALEPGTRQALVRVQAGAVSTGTETTMIRQRRANPSLPEKGNAAVRLGYSAAGVIESVGSDYIGPQPGTSVAVYGAPYVGHADRLVVGQNLVAPVPSGLLPEEAAFGGVGAIALHAVRLAGVELGQRIGVLGLGVIGQLTAQLARAAGAWVLASDLLESRREIARRTRAVCNAVAPEAWKEAVAEFTRGNGLDAVLVCAGTPDDSGPAQAGLEAVRYRGRVIIVGNVHTDWPREMLFGKEATVQVSRAGGFGRYDAVYERDGYDMPAGLVPWTEGRNLRCFIELLAAERVNVSPLISDVLPVESAAAAYQRLIDHPQETLALVLQF